MDHKKGNFARTGDLHGLALGLMGNFIGEDNHLIGIADFIHEIALIAAYAFQLTAVFMSRRHIVTFQTVDAANQGHAHRVSL